MVRTLSEGELLPHCSESFTPEAFIVLRQTLSLPAGATAQHEPVSMSSLIACILVCHCGQSDS